LGLWQSPPATRTCQSGALKEYGEIEETMAPTVLTMVSEWILKNAKP